LNTIPEESRNFYNMIPFELDGKNLKVATADPTNLQALEALEFLGQKQNLQINLYVTSPVAVGAATKDKNLENVVGAALQDIKQKEEARIQLQPTEQAKAAKQQVIEDAP